MMLHCKNAARTVFSHAYTGYEMDHVDQKIAQIEEARREIERHNRRH